MVQGDDLNQSRLATVVCIPLTSNPNWADAPGSLMIPAKIGGLQKDSVARIFQILAVNKQDLIKRIGHVPRSMLQMLFLGLDTVLGR